MSIYILTVECVSTNANTQIPRLDYYLLLTNVRRAQGKKEDLAVKKKNK